MEGPGYHSLSLAKGGEIHKISPPFRIRERTPRPTSLPQRRSLESPAHAHLPDAPRVSRSARRVTTPRSVFWLCERSRTDASYARYPRLPMLRCPGFEPGTPGGPEPEVDEKREK